MSPIRALIVDDEPVARELLRSLLAREGDIEIVGESRNGREALDTIRSRQPDVVFLDIQMPGMSGLEVLEQLGEATPSQVVFVTAHDEHALRAFELHALDYLLKPFDETRLRDTLDRVRHQRARREERDFQDRVRAFLDHLAAGPRRDRIAVRDGDETVLLRPGEVDWIEAEANYVRFHAGGRSYLSRATLASIEQRLDPAAFVRIHRSTIVNVERVRKLSSLGRGDLRLTLIDGTELVASRRYKARLDELLPH